MSKTFTAAIVSVAGLAASAAGLTLGGAIAAAEGPSSIAVQHAERLIATIHAQGAQIYECKAHASGTLAWQFREPIATLIEEGQTVGRHYAGPRWELSDGSIVVAKLAGRAPSATPQDIPLLKLEVTERAGSGRLSDATTIQRINTRGGAAEGACSTAGALLSVPYVADYVFYRNGGARPTH